MCKLLTRLRVGALTFNQSRHARQSVSRLASHVSPRVSRLTPHGTPHATRLTSRHTPHATRHTSHATRLTPHVHAHVSRLTPHVSRHTSPCTSQPKLRPNLWSSVSTMCLLPFVTVAKLRSCVEGSQLGVATAQHAQ